MGAAAASIIGSVLDSSAKSGMKNNSEVGQVSHPQTISNAGDQKAQINQAGMQPVQPTNSGDNGNGASWSQLADMAKSLYSSANTQANTGTQKTEADKTVSNDGQ